MTQTQHLKQKIRLATALGLTKACMTLAKDEEFNKEGFLVNLREIAEILTKEIEVENDE